MCCVGIYNTQYHNSARDNGEYRVSRLLLLLSSSLIIPFYALPIADISNDETLIILIRTIYVYTLLYFFTATSVINAIYYSVIILYYVRGKVKKHKLILITNSITAVYVYNTTDKKKNSRSQPIVICSVTREILFGDSLRRRSLAFSESVVRYILLTSALSCQFPDEKGYLMGSGVLKSKNA